MIFLSKFFLYNVIILIIICGSTAAQSRLSTSVDIKIKIVPAASSLISTEYPSENAKIINQNCENKEVLIQISERNQSTIANRSTLAEDLKIINSKNKLLVCANIGDEIELNKISRYERLHFIHSKIDLSEELQSEPSITIVY